MIKKCPEKIQKNIWWQYWKLKKGAKFYTIFLPYVVETPVNVKLKMGREDHYRIVENEWEHYFTIPHHVTDKFPNTNLT